MNKVCIWYPSGGFGHFVNAVLTLHGQGFVRPKNKTFNFSLTGNSHNLQLVCPKYMNGQPYSFEFKEPKKYSVLIDNGINNERQTWRETFSGAECIKLCYSEYTWAVIARTLIEKAMNSTLEFEVNIGQDLWPESADWSLREKWFLYLRDHPLRHAWKDSDDCINFYVDDMFDYQRFKKVLQKNSIQTTDFKQLHHDWLESNHRYIDPLLTGLEIINGIKKQDYFDLSSYKDIWLQAVVNYFIWLEWNFEVPANDYADWFTNTQEISILLSDYGVQI